MTEKLEVIEAEPMTDEQKQIAIDLSRNAVDKVRQVMADMWSLTDNSHQDLTIMMAVIRDLIYGTGTMFAVHERDTTTEQRVMTIGAISTLSAIAIEDEMLNGIMMRGPPWVKDGREIFRFLSKRG